MHIEEARKIPNRKFGGAFHELIKLDPKDLVRQTTLARNTLWSLSQYSVCSGDRENKYSLDLNVF